MKSYIAPMIVCTLLILVTGDNAAAYTPPSREEVIRSAMEAQKKIPLERQSIWYASVDAETLVPFQRDPNTGITYYWRGVRLPKSQMPRLHANGSFGVHPVPAPQGEVREIDPKIWYSPANAVDYVPGYFDPEKGVFLPWKGVVLSRDQLPQDAEAKELILPPKSAGFAVETLSVDPPPDYAARLNLKTESNAVSADPTPSRSTAIPTATPRTALPSVIEQEAGLWWIAGAIVLAIIVFLIWKHKLGGENS